MPLTDFWWVLRWWGTLFFVGAAAYPLTRRLFSGWHDQGYIFSKAVGFAAVTWLVYVLGTARLAPFTQLTIMGAIIGVFTLGIFVHEKPTSRAQSVGAWKKTIVLIGFEEVAFFSMLLFWSWIKAHEPSIRGLEKFMDYGFMQSILRSAYFPPTDMWYPPLPINYYYFGHLMTAVLTKLSGMNLAVTFNLMLSTIFALCITTSFSIGYQLIYASRIISHRKQLVAIINGTLTAYLVTLAGNMQTIYAFTRGYTGEDVSPFWLLTWKASEFFRMLPEGLERYWYANATRFIPFTIHEFPSYSFVVSDIHGHVLSIPFVLLAVGMIFVMFGSHAQTPRRNDVFALGMYGFLVGVLLMTNALDGPIYLGLIVLFLAIMHTNREGIDWKSWAGDTGVILIGALLSSLPFLSQFRSFVNGIAVNCPLSFLADSRIGPILFEGVEKCQRSPLWMMWLLWGFFWFAGGIFLLSKITSLKELRNVPLLWKTKFTHIDRIIIILYLFSFALIIFPEFFYFKDIYPQHFRSNTMFKLGYQAFIMWSIVSGYALTHLFVGKEARSGLLKKFWVRFVVTLLIIPQLFLVVIYPWFSVRSYFGGVTHYEGLYGMTWLAREYPDDYFAILWLIEHGKADGTTLVEADGDSYTDYERFSVFTGIPTTIGWAVHEWLWRGSYDAVSPRREDVRIIYESEDLDETKRLLSKYNVRFIVVGTIERQKFSALQEGKFEKMATVAYRLNDTVIYEWTNRDY